MTRLTQPRDHQRDERRRLRRLRCLVNHHGVELELEQKFRAGGGDGGDDDACGVK